MNVVSFVTATLVLAGTFSAPRQEIAAAITPIPLSHLLTEGPIIPSATRMNAPTILRDAATTHNLDTASLSAQSWSSEGPQMSKREVKTLIKNAKTSEDHKKIASYFAQQAQLFAKKSYEYQAQSALIAANPARYKTKYPSAYDDARSWEQYFAAKSREADTAADLHQQLAVSVAERER